MNWKGRFGQTPLFESALAGQVDGVRFLLDRGADPRILSNDGAGPLYFACVRGCAEIVDLLIERGADVNALRRTDLSDGPSFASPLQMAISNGHARIAKKLIDAGANLDHRVNGITIEEYAVKNGCQEIVAYLNSMKARK